MVHCAPKASAAEKVASFHQTCFSRLVVLFSDHMKLLDGVGFPIISDKVSWWVMGEREGKEGWLHEVFEGGVETGFLQTF